MGITIYYEYEMATENTDRIIPILTGLGERARQLGAKKVYEVMHFSQAEIKAIAKDIRDERQDYISRCSATVEVAKTGITSVYVSVLPNEIYLLHVEPGDGCEPALFAFCSFPETIEFKGKRVPTGLDGRWNYGTFCKTEYAKRFAYCHKLVISLLDYLKKSGDLISLEVFDDTGYWDDRNEENLERFHQESQEFLAALAGVLLDSGTEAVKAPILDNPKFEHLEMEGRAKNPKLTKALEDGVKVMKGIQKIIDE